MERPGYSTLTWSEMSWKESRSPLETRTSMPLAPALVANVAMMSSASRFSCVSQVTFMASRRRWMFSV